MPTQRGYPSVHGGDTVSPLRRLFSRFGQRLLAVPMAYSAGAVILAALMVWIDRQVPSDSVPEVVTTSVDGGREVLGTIAMGLITAYTLLLSLVLIAVQLASSQFSPRTLRKWLGDAVLQRAVGLVLATVVFSLLVLYQTRDLDDADTFEPNLSVLTAIILGLAALAVVLRSVDHLADSMRVGSVARTVLDETLELIAREEDQPSLDRPNLNPAPQLLPDAPEQPPGDAHVVTCLAPGWVQSIDLEAILDACPDHSTVQLPQAVGAFAVSGIPIAWLSPVPPDDEDALEAFDRAVHSAISVGDVRTMDQDVGFGITRLVDIALRALSPSLNDPNTAKEVIAHLGEILLALLAQEERPATVTRESRTVRSIEHAHRRYVEASFDQIRHAAIDTPQVLAVLVQTLLTVRNEVVRRGLHARPEVIDDLLAEIEDDVRRSGLSEREKARIFELLP